jgi:hypothetical protein
MNDGSFYFTTLAVDPMHSCDICHRTYTTKGALTRHLNNHTQRLVCTCPECGVSFRRKDLMARHVRIHEAATTSPKPRQRSHTACQRCRRLRGKCNGQQPCAVCSKAQIPCVYPRSGQRLSQQRPQDSASNGVANSRIVELEGDDTPDISVEFDIFAADATMVMGKDADSSSIDPVSQSSDPVPDWSFDANWPFSTAWQWTHEDVFLGNSPMLSDDMFWFGEEHPTSALNNPAPTNLPTHPTSTDTVNPEETGGLAVRGSNIHADSTFPRGLSRREAEALIGRIVELAIGENAYTKRRNLDWLTFDAQLSNVVTSDDQQQPRSGSSTCLDRLAQRYFVHFHPLWPLIHDTDVELRALHPVLYLTLASIGALYHGTSTAFQFGSMLHTHIRDALLHQNIARGQTPVESLDLGRAMLLIQVSALYFEQGKAFTAAQQLGAKLNAHAHRMQLFTSPCTSTLTDSVSGAEVEALAAESRRMLAYGMLRAETFMSIFLNRKPMLSYEEMDLPLPLTGFSVHAASQLQIRLTSGQRTPLSSDDGLFSDLVRIALDEDEILPAMKPTDLELLLFGLQNDVWRFCHDHRMFMRLTQQQDPRDCHQVNTNICSSGPDLLKQTSRKMQRLTREYNATVAALARWKAALALSQLTYPPSHDRSAYLSGLVLYELSLLRLSAPVESILHVVYHYDDISIGDPLLCEVWQWTRSSKAVDSISHAESIWQVLYAETGRKAAEQAKFNILALIAVHHAAAVTWAVIGSGKQEHIHLTMEESRILTLERANAASIMAQFAQLYPKITSSWGMESSFHKIVTRLASLEFPLDSARTAGTGETTTER